MKLHGTWLLRCKKRCYWIEIKEQEEMLKLQSFYRVIFSNSESNFAAEQAVLSRSRFFITVSELCLISRSLDIKKTMRVIYERYMFELLTVTMCWFIKMSVGFIILLILVSCIILNLC